MTQEQRIIDDQRFMEEISLANQPESDLRQAVGWQLNGLQDPISISLRGSTEIMLELIESETKKAVASALDEVTRAAKSYWNEDDHADWKEAYEEGVRRVGLRHVINQQYNPPPSNRPEKGKWKSRLRKHSISIIQIGTSLRR